MGDDAQRRKLGAAHAVVAPRQARFPGRTATAGCAALWHSRASIASAPTPACAASPTGRSYSVRFDLPHHPHGGRLRPHNHVIAEEAGMDIVVAQMGIDVVIAPLQAVDHEGVAG